MGDKAAITALTSQMEEMLKIIKQQTEHTSQIPTILDRIQSIATDIKSIESRTTTLEENVTTIFTEMNEVRTNSAHMSSEINFIQQANLNHSFSIRGLPGDLPKNQALKVAIALGTVIGLNLTADDFSTSPYVVYHRDKKESHIVGAFHDLRTKQKAIVKFKENQPITVEDLCDGLASDSVFRGKKVLFKNLLTRQNQQLLYDARQHTDLFLFVWESNGRILARRTADAPPIVIRCHNHLMEIVSRLKSVSGEPNRMETSTTSPPK